METLRLYYVRDLDIIRAHVGVMGDCFDKHACRASVSQLGRGKRIMLKNLPIMVCCTAPKMYLLYSTNTPIMLDKLSTKQLS